MTRFLRLPSVPSDISAGQHSGSGGVTLSMMGHNRNKWPRVVWRVSGHVKYARDCRRSIKRRYYYEQIKQQVRSVLRGQAMVRHEAALIMAVMHDA